GNVAVDLAHLLSELMENATQFSPPDTRVEVAGHLAGDGSYQLTITDHGIGMSADQLARANEILQNPPVIGLELGRSLGFTVVSRIAARLGLGVQVTTSTHGGVTALVVLPPTLVVGAAAVPASEPEVAARPEPVVAAAPAPVPDPTPPTPESVGGPESVVASPPVVQAPPVVTPDVQAPPAVTPAVQAPPVVTPVRGVESDSAPAPHAPETPSPLEQLARLLEGGDQGPHREAISAPNPIASGPAPGAPDVFSPLEEALRRATESPAPAPPAGDLPRRRQPPAGGPHQALPSRRPADPGPPNSPAPAPPAGSLPSAEAPTAAPPAPDPASAVDGSGTTSSLPPPPVRPAAEVAAVDERLTRAGLVRRRPRRVEVPETSRYGAPAPVTATARDPEEVRQMLSRYRSGLRKGRRARRDGADGHDPT
ncbi:MAG: hypothetical protein D6683_12085, partial [Actinomyces sp.]